MPQGQIDAQLLAFYNDLARRAEATARPLAGRFVNAADKMELQNRFLRNPNVSVVFVGGYPQAERCVVCMVPTDYAGDLPEAVACIHIRWNGAYGTVGHRDLLGALLGLGISRDYVGDIVLGDNDANAFVVPSLMQFILQNLSKAGRVSFSVTQGELPREDAMLDAGGEERVVSVQSLRMDALLGAGWNLARGKIKTVIQSGAIEVNWQVCQKADAQIKPGDVITWRGKGRLMIEAVSLPNKKGRVHVTVRKFH